MGSPAYYQNVMEIVSLLPDHDQILSTVIEPLADGRYQITCSLYAADANYRIQSGEPLWTAESETSLRTQAGAVHLGWLSAWYQPGVDARHPPEHPGSPDREGLPDLLTYDDRGYLITTEISPPSATTWVAEATPDWMVRDVEPLWSDTYSAALSGFEQVSVCEALEQIDLNASVRIRHPERIRKSLDAEALSTWFAAKVSPADNPTPYPPGHVVVSPIPEAGIRVITALPEGNGDRLGSLRLMAADTPAVFWHHELAADVAESDARGLHQSVTEHIREYVAQTPAVTTSAITALVAEVVTGERPDLSSPSVELNPPLLPHPHQNAFRMGAVAPHQWVLWKDWPGKAPELIRHNAVPGQPPRFWPSAETLRADLSQMAGRYRADPQEAPIPPEIQSQVNQALGGVRKALTGTRPPAASAAPSDPSRRAYYYSAVGQAEGADYVLWTGTPDHPQVALAKEQPHQPLMVWRNPAALLKDAGILNPQLVPASDMLTERCRNAHRIVMDTPAVRTPKPKSTLGIG